MTPSGAATVRTATAADLLALPEDQRFHEVFGGELAVGVLFGDDPEG